MFHHHNKETLNCLRLLCVCLSITLPSKSSVLDDQLNAEFFVQRSTRSLFDSLTYKLSFYLGGKQLNCLLYLNIEVQIKSCEILSPSPFYRRMVAIVRDWHALVELRAFLAFSLLALNIGFVGVREKLIAGNRTGKAFASFPSFVSLWQEENFTLGTHPIILTSSQICINYSISTRQWSFVIWHYRT